MIREANISYAPEKIDEFIAEINKEIETAKAIYESALSKVKGMNVGDIAEDQSAAEAYKDKLVRAEDAIRKKHTKYFDIVDMYEAGDMPKNVYQLWKLTNTLDDYAQAL